MTAPNCVKAWRGLNNGAWLEVITPAESGPNANKWCLAVWPSNPDNNDVECLANFYFDGEDEAIIAMEGAE